MNDQTNKQLLELRERMKLEEQDTSGKHECFTCLYSGYKPSEWPCYLCSVPKHMRTDNWARRT